MRGERLGHEADFHQGPDVSGKEGVENAIGDGEVVYRRAVGALGVDISRSPLERALAVAGGEQIVGAEINRNLAIRGKLAEEFLAVGSVDVVGLVGAEEVPDRCIWTGSLVRMDLNDDRGCARG